MFYRVRANDSIRETFVFDEATPAGAVYEVLRNRADVRVVVCEVVDDFGEVLSVMKTDKTVREAQVLSRIETRKDEQS